MAFTKQYPLPANTFLFFQPVLLNWELAESLAVIVLLYYSAILSFSLELNEVITIVCVEATSGDSLSKQISNNCTSKEYLLNKNIDNSASSPLDKIFSDC